VIGNAIITVSTFAVAMVVMYAVNSIGLLRITADGENYGLDLHEHGISAYPEYVISSMGRPGGMTPDPAHRFSATEPLPGLTRGETAR
jgi:Amt family ammonium transporter